MVAQDREEVGRVEPPLQVTGAQEALIVVVAPAPQG